MADTTTKVAQAPFPANIATYDAIDVRKTLISAMLAHNGNVAQGVPGQLMGGGGLAWGGSDVYINENIYIVNASSTSNGSYLVYFPQTKVGTITADATYDRIDIIYLQVKDNSIDSSGQGQANLVYSTGTPAASPVANTLPANSLLLATLRVPKSGSGGTTSTWNCPNSSLNSAVYTCTSGSRPSTSLTRPGHLIFETDTNNLMMWTGSQWVQASFRDRVTVCTSTSHPSSPKAGDLIYETDTTKTYIYSGSQWLAMGGGVKLTTYNQRPSNPQQGDVCYETDTQNMYVYTSSGWSLAGGDAKVTTNGGRPANPSPGDMVFESDTQNLYVYSGTAWALASDNSKVTTSTGSRPGNAVSGDMLFESDTGNIYVYNGSSWSIAAGRAHMVSNGARPSNPVNGDIVFEIDTQNMYVYNNGNWALASDNSSIVTSSTHPSKPVKGDQIYETDTKRAYVYDGSNWQPLTVDPGTDTGWQNLSAYNTTYWTASASPNVPQYRIIGNTVYLRGSFTAANSGAAGQIICAIPNGKPTADINPVTTVVNGNGTAVHGLRVSVNGYLLIGSTYGTFNASATVPIYSNYRID